MDEFMDFLAMEAATGIASQRFRYIIDQGILPGGPLPSWRRGRGSPRLFTQFEAFGLACTALLLKAGLRRRVVIACLETLSAYRDKRREVSDVPLFQAFQDRASAYLDVGDGDFVRLVGSEDAKRNLLQFGWVGISGKAPVELYEPLVTIRVDVARLRRLVKA
jgi:hypothetical protein